MQVLTLNEIEMVNGAGDAADAVTVGGALGGGAGLSLAISGGYTANAALAATALGAAAGAALAASFGIGYATGTWIYNNWM